MYHIGENCKMVDILQNGIDIRVILDAVDELPLFYKDPNSNYHNTLYLLPIINDFLKDYFQSSFDLESLKTKLSEFSVEERKLILIIIGIMSIPNFHKTLLESEKIDKLNFASKYLIKDIFQLVLSLGKLFLPSVIFTDNDRKEEVVRKLIAIFKIQIQGETFDDSNMRILQIDSVELKKIETTIQKKIQDALEEARRQEAAAKVNRE
jgi:hypothetical protein